jgi:hypothetical protein
MVVAAFHCRSKIQVVLVVLLVGNLYSYVLTDTVAAFFEGASVCLLLMAGLHNGSPGFCRHCVLLT